MSSTKDLTDHARFLRAAAPREFEEFYGAMARYTGQQSENLVNTTENVFVAQGHAQQCLKLLRALGDAKNG